SRCHAMFWWTVCVGYARTCGGERKCWQFDGRGRSGGARRENGGRRTTPALAGRWAVLPVGRAKRPSPVVPAKGKDRDGTLSCLCLTRKRKNFVSRARATPLRSVSLS